jgi:hypothetical protein
MMEGRKTLSDLWGKPFPRFNRLGTSSHTFLLSGVGHTLNGAYVPDK